MHSFICLGDKGTVTIHSFIHILGGEEAVYYDQDERLLDPGDGERGDVPEGEGNTVIVIFVV